MNTKTFAFALGQRVKACISGEPGRVIGRAEYLRSNPGYLVEYLAADGRQAQGWFDEESLIAGIEPDQADAKPEVTDEAA